MRSDAAHLLARLGRKDFRYREFTDNFADMELWPVFEALLTDERVVGKPLSALESRNVEDFIPETKVQPARPASPPRGPGLFDRYGEGSRPAAQGEGNGELRSFLQRLSKKDGEGRN
ncbi:hypothetical protein L288_01400 [Sphingobium quisquiliarum P25]|uniref:Uncharacterized protein n=1 Tax=Sphingobium quisquiliarum P25 TaxID=1329909 RepID=T0HDV2_9SPHN|nr:hypothetical protein [Sphingobium quisquiliarum]EQB14526.1 hypothetical protein L288_01400 [Sphingobium quisquiliarum P25]EZP72327.1 hypothetical protein BV96_01760 [Sphingomonas paucimobilis]